MKTNFFLLSSLALISLGLQACTNAEGRFRPIDPIGRAIFNAIDRPSQDYYYEENPYQYTDYNRPPGRDYVWVEGEYVRDAHGRRVYVPAHWARLAR